MSWFSELTSKAEAMLVKLDQETAQALQNQQILSRSTKSDVNRNDVGHQLEDTQSNSTNEDHVSEKDKLIARADAEVQDETISADGDFDNNNGIANSGLTPDNDQAPSLDHSAETSDFASKQDTSNGQISEFMVAATHSPNTSRKFKLKTSKLRANIHNGGAGVTSTLKNNYSRQSKSDSPLVSLGADDIRASINKSLQEYSQSFSRDQEEQTTYSSHYDNQPNLISHSTADHNGQNGRLHPSPSFTINVPDDYNDQSTNITSQILSQSALKKKSPFNLHRVINKLANQRGQPQLSLFGDKTKIRLRRAQMRAASYLRRMNYYFQAYPTMKYWMIGYLVVLQILVVYVLFFYQSSGSSSYLINQVNQQQQEMSNSLHHLNSERIHPYSSDQEVNKFR
jgi:hypothetical protein